ncbi:MAG: hypothetical protein U1D55_17805 [Phycisphaerae bacterium]
MLPAVRLRTPSVFQSVRNQDSDRAGGDVRIARRYYKCRHCGDTHTP